MPEASSPRRRVAAWLAEAGEALTGILLPAGCRLCERLLVRATRLPFCDDCLASFARIGGTLCQVCGLPLESLEAATGAGASRAPAELLCAACRLQAFRFDRARSVFRYQEAVVRAIVLLKFEEMEPLADWFADQLAEAARQAGQDQADVVAAVPLHKIRRRERGFNQAELLSKRVAQRLKLDHQGVLLVRKRPRPDKQLLTERERWAAARGAFAVREESRVDKQRVLLVDDVMTTGATLDACAKALRDAGASTVYGLTVARAVMLPPRRAGR